MGSKRSSAAQSRIKSGASDTCRYSSNGGRGFTPAAPLTELLVAPPTAAATVVRTDLAAILLAAVVIRIELRRVLDLLLGPIGIDRLFLAIHTVDHARREHDLLPKDPRP